MSFTPAGYAMTVTLTDAVTKIDALNLEGYRDKLIEQEGFTPDRADYAIRCYRAFLKIRLERSASPTKDVDKVWHTHILDTRKYAEDCTAIFGRFLHHTPSGSTCDSELATCD